MLRKIIPRMSTSKTNFQAHAYVFSRKAGRILPPLIRPLLHPRQQMQYEGKR